jgi:hypothetical protein
MKRERSGGLDVVGRLVDSRRRIVVQDSIGPWLVLGPREHHESQLRRQIVGSSEYMIGTGDQRIVSKLNGTGPYRLESWDRGTEVSLARNDAYWGTPAKNERLIVRWGGDSGQRVSELQNGTVDGIDGIDPAGVATVAGDVTLQAEPRAGRDVVYLGFATADPPPRELPSAFAPLLELRSLEHGRLEGRLFAS